MTTINTWKLAADAYRWGLGLVQWPFRLMYKPCIVGLACTTRILIRVAGNPLRHPKAASPPCESQSWGGLWASLRVAADAGSWEQPA